MPYNVKKQSCKQSDGESGEYTVVKKKKDNKTEKVSCHKTKEKAASSIRAKYVSETNETVKLSVALIRKIIKEDIKKFSSC